MKCNAMQCNSMGSRMRYEWNILCLRATSGIGRWVLLMTARNGNLLLLIIIRNYHHERDRLTSAPPNPLSARAPAPRFENPALFASHPLCYGPPWVIHPTDTQFTEIETKCPTVFVPPPVAERFSLTHVTACSTLTPSISKRAAASNGRRRCWCASKLRVDSFHSRTKASHKHMLL